MEAENCNQVESNSANTNWHLPRWNKKIIWITIILVCFVNYNECNEDKNKKIKDFSIWKEKVKNFVTEPFRILLHCSSRRKNARWSYFRWFAPFFGEHRQVSNVGRWAEEDEKVWLFRAGPFPARNALTLVTSGFRTTFYASACLCNRLAGRIESSFVLQNRCSTSTRQWWFIPFHKNININRVSLSRCSTARDTACVYIITSLCSCSRSFCWSNHFRRWTCSVQILILAYFREHLLTAFQISCRFVFIKKWTNLFSKYREPRYQYIYFSKYFQNNSFSMETQEVSKDGRAGGRAADSLI